MHRIRICTALLALAAVLAASGCRYMGDDKGLFVDARDDYLDARIARPLEVPPELTDVRIADALPIPQTQAPAAAKVFPKEAPRPEVFVGRNVDAVRIQKLGERTWLVLPDPPAAVWPLVKQFLADNGIGIAREDTGAGMIESIWVVVAERDYGDAVRTAIRDGRRAHAEAEQAAGAAETVEPGRDRITLRVERGIRRGATEVHIRHQRADGLSETLAAPIPAVEAEVTARLAEYFASGVAAPVSRVGRDVANEDKAMIVRDDQGYPFLRLRIPYDRAWATVGQALERAEVEVSDTDPANSTYHALFPLAGSGGWLRRVVPGGDARAVRIAIHVERVDERSVVVRVAGQGDDAALDADVAQQVLLTLREFAA